MYLGLLAPFDSALVFCFQRGLEYAAAAADGAAGPPLPGMVDVSPVCMDWLSFIAGFSAKSGISRFAWRP